MVGTNLELLAPPRYATARDHSRATYGGHTAAVAAAMRWPLLPWQRLVADVAGEVDADGVLIYSTVIITVQRQAGKTTLDLANDVQNCLSGPNRRVWYTAQSGQHAGDKWRDMVDNYFMKSPLAGTAHPSYSNGSQALTFMNGSTLRPHPPTADSLHSKQSDKNTIDEAWFFDHPKFNALKGAIVPTQTTRRKLTGQRPQLWIMSTEGTAESEALNELLAVLRAAAAAGETVPGVAFFDWGIDPTVELPDLDDAGSVDRFLEAVAAAHPGYRHLFELDDLKTWLHELGVSEFARAYGNRRTGATTRIIPESAWNAAGTAMPLPAGLPICFGAAVGMDGQDAGITATTTLPDGRKLTEVIDHRPGTGWIAPRLIELATKHDAPVVVDNAGPSADLYDRISRADGVAMVPLTTAQLSAAAAGVFAGIVNKSDTGEALPPIWLHRPHQGLNDAAEYAAKRSVGDGAWVWGRRASVGSIALLEAATLSSWGIDHLPERVGIQLFA